MRLREHSLMSNRKARTAHIEIRKEEEVNTIATTKIEKFENDNNPRLWRSIEHAIMKRHVLLNRVLAFGLLAVMVLVPVGQTAQAQGKKSKDLVAPVVFQAAGPTRRLDSEHGRCVPRRSGRSQQRQ